MKTIAFALLVLLAPQMPPQPTSESIDVTAVKEHHTRKVKERIKGGWKVYYVEEARWTCADPQRALLTSVDGTLHWCRKAQF